MATDDTSTTALREELFRLKAANVRLNLEVGLYRGRAEVMATVLRLVLSEMRIAAEPGRRGEIVDRDAMVQRVASWIKRIESVVSTPPVSSNAMNIYERIEEIALEALDDIHGARMPLKDAIMLALAKRDRDLANFGFADAKTTILVPSACKRCSECEGQEHHWIDSYEEGSDATHACKHCEIEGDECDTCDGEGERYVGDTNAGLCPKCRGYGVLPRATN